MNMEYKKYSVCETLEEAITNISIISSNLILDGKLEPGDIWSEPIPLTGKFEIGETVKHVTGKYFFCNPDVEYMNGTACNEQTDINPNSEKIEYYKIYDLLNDDNMSKFKNWTIAPHSLDYKKGLKQKLHPKMKFDKLGNLIEVYYYLNVEIIESNLSYSDPILKYNAEYIHDENTGYVINRTVTRSWIMTDDTWSEDVKTSTKYYTRIQARNVGNKRRKSLIDNLVIEIGYFIMITEQTDARSAELLAIPFFDSISASLSTYYESGNMKDSITGSFPLFLDVYNRNDSFLNNIIPLEVIGVEGVSIKNYILNRIDVSPLDV